MIEDYNSQYNDLGYGKDPYWDNELYDKETLQFPHEERFPTDDEDDPEILDTKLSRALIELWQTNTEANYQEHTDEYRKQEVHKATNSLLDEKAVLHVLVTKEGEPAYIPLSTRPQNYRPQSETADAIFPHGLLRTDFRRPDGHWGPLQCNTRSRPQANMPFSASIHNKKGPCSIVSNKGRKSRLRNPRVHRRV